MPANDRQTGPAARPGKVSRRDAMRAREELDAGGLSHQDRRRLRAISRTWEQASERRHQRFRHLTITAASGIAAAALTGLALGFVPAAEAAGGSGVTGTFVVASLTCARRAGCTWVGTFEGGGDVIPDVAYEGILPGTTPPGTRIPVRYPGDDRAYALHGTHTWALDLVTMIFVGVVVACLVYLTPAGLRRARRAPAA